MPIPATPNSSDAAQSGQRSLRNALYVAAMAMTVPYGLVSASDMPTLAWLIGIAWAISLTLWCAEDARLHGRPLPQFSLWVIWLTWPISVPICVIRLYGRFGVILVLIHIAIFAALAIAPALLVSPV